VTNQNGSSNVEFPVSSQKRKCTASCADLITAEDAILNLPEAQHLPATKGKSERSSTISGVIRRALWILAKL
jgi:hypothetical protein